MLADHSIPKTEKIDDQIYYTFSKALKSFQEGQAAVADWTLQAGIDLAMETS